LGSPLRFTAADGTLLESYAYDEFGNDLTGNQGNSQPFGFTGYQYDNVAQTYFAQAREYVPGVGRFSAEDIVKGMAIVPFTLNEYAYCWNNPLVSVDLDGLSPNIPEGLTVFIDPGHGGSDPGATITEKTNFWTGKITRPALNEKDVNLEVSLMVRDILEDNGITVYMSSVTSSLKFRI
jgi:RHS repeat-associated protein